MEISDLSSLRPELERFVSRFDECIKTRPSRAHLRRYVSGQLSDLPRKSAEPIALATGVPPRTLQELLSLHLWDETGVGPIAFVRVHRLFRARRLLKSGCVNRVTEAAIRAGFSEFGRFASSYRALFGELPSSTLRDHLAEIA